MASVKFDESLCKGCGLCIDACPKDILVQSKTKSNNSGYFIVECIDMDKCIGCCSCAIMCPDCVIEVDK